MSKYAFYLSHVIYCWVSKVLSLVSTNQWSGRKQPVDTESWEEIVHLAEITIVCMTTTALYKRHIFICHINLCVILNFDEHCAIRALFNMSILVDTCFHAWRRQVNYVYEITFPSAKLFQFIVCDLSDTLWRWHYHQ